MFAEASQLVVGAQVADATVQAAVSVTASAAASVVGSTAAAPGAPVLSAGFGAFPREISLTALLIAVFFFFFSASAAPHFCVGLQLFCIFVCPLPGRRES